MNSKVSVVDDEPAVRASVVDLLESEGIMADDFASVEDFLCAYTEDDSPCNCVIADLRLPGKSGLDLKRILAEREDDVPVILLTGFRDVTSDTEASELGVYAMLEKPYPPGDLVNTVRQALQTRTVDSDGALTDC